MSTNTKISNVISSKLPFFVRNDHPLFISFLEAYYEYLEQSESTLAEGKVLERIDNIPSYFDVDHATLDDFTEKLFDEFMHLIPQTVAADRGLMLKNIKDFYRAKGSEKALRFLLRALFNEETEVYYPKKDILKASDGKWFEQKSLRVTNTALDFASTTSLADLEKYANRKVVGLGSGAHATVERVDRFFLAGTMINELIISNISGAFDDNEVVRANNITIDGTVETLTANTFGSWVSTISIVTPGLGYSVGEHPIVEGSGTGANLRITKVTTGGIATIGISEGGAGFLVGDYVSYSGEGTGANSELTIIDDSEAVHPNTYNIWIDTISMEAQTAISNTVYSNLGNAISHANTSLENALGSFVYGPCGPATGIQTNDNGSGYSVSVGLDISANTRVKSLGILGKMTIQDAGQGYTVGDRIEFVSQYGIGANAEVITVDSGSLDEITGVAFTANTGHFIGGGGYLQANLPTTNVSTTTGNGANIVVDAILGDGETLAISVGPLGSIDEITIIQQGSDYSSATINLESIGDGTAQVTATVVTGAFTYPGRYLNDDGHLSSYNFLQHMHYYQNYSYVVKLAQSLKNYRQTLKNLNHPIGLKLFGEYLTISNTSVNVSAVTQQTIFTDGSYIFDNVDNTVIVSKTTHGISNSANIYLEYIDGTLLANGNGRFIVVSVPDANTFNVNYISAESNGAGNVSIGKIS